jgi:hypothetical protein
MDIWTSKQQGGIYLVVPGWSFYLTTLLFSVQSPSNLFLHIHTTNAIMAIPKYYKEGIYFYLFFHTTNTLMAIPKYYKEGIYFCLFLFFIFFFHLATFCPPKNGIYGTLTLQYTCYILACLDNEGRVLGNKSRSIRAWKVDCHGCVEKHGLL